MVSNWGLNRLLGRLFRGTKNHHSNGNSNKVWNQSEQVFACSGASSIYFVALIIVVVVVLRVLFVIMIR